MKRRVLFVVPSLRLGGGVERIIQLISNELSKKKDVIVLTFYDCKEEYPLKKIKRISLKERMTNNPLKKIAKLFSRARAIRKVTKEEKASVVVGFMEEANFPCLIAKKNGLKTPIIATTHINPKNHFPPHYHLLTKMLYSKAEQVITVSKGMKKYFRKIGVKQLKTIYNPVDLRCVKKLSMEKLSENEEKIFAGDVIINIGRLTKQKNQDLLIRVFNQVKKSNQKLKLVILGEGEEREKLETLIQKLQLENSIFLLGNKSNVFKYLRRAKLFLFTSRYEGFGIVLIEAMACGLPIVTNDCPTGPAEIVDPNAKSPKKAYEKKEYGLLVKYDSIKGFIDGTNLLLNSKQLYERLKKESLKRAKKFDIQTIGKEYNTTIDCCIDKAMRE